MIGKKLKSLATANGMRVASGVAYGSYHGYAASLCEGAGYILVTFLTRVPIEQIGAIEQRMAGRSLTKEFRVRKFNLTDSRVDILFTDNPGTMKRVTAFLDWFVPMLDEAGASKADVCVACGAPLTDADPWKLVDGTAIHLHAPCAEHMRAQAQQERQQRLDSDTGSYATGVLGAFLGAIVGAIPWAVVQYNGYILSILGLLIGWCSKKGYELLHGKSGRGKPAIIILAAILGVVIGCLGSDLLTVMVMISNNEIRGATMADIPLIFSNLFQDGDYVGALVRNLLMGGVFALIGMISVFQQLKLEQHSFTMSDLP